MKNEKILTEYFKKHLINRYIILNMKFYLYATRLPPRCPNHFITFEYAILRDNIVKMTTSSLTSFFWYLLYHKNNQNNKHWLQMPFATTKICENFQILNIKYTVSGVLRKFFYVACITECTPP